MLCCSFTAGTSEQGRGRIWEAIQRLADAVQHLEGTEQKYNLMCNFLEMYSILNLIFTVQLHVMQCTVLLSQFCLSVSLSVCLSVRRVYYVMPSSLSNICRKWLTPFEKRRLRQISAHNVSTERDSKKVQLWRIESRPQAFQQAMDGVHMLPLGPERVAHWAIFGNP